MQPLAVGYGGCLVSDRITVDGRLVGYMNRTEASSPEDSGWSFLAGDETEVYLNDASNAGIFDVNTIANHDPAILRYLDLPTNTHLVRQDDGQFIACGVGGAVQ